MVFPDLWRKKASLNPFSYQLLPSLLSSIASIISLVQSLSRVRLFVTPWTTHGLQHVRLPCPSPTPRACSNSLSQWCHPTISFSVVPFSSCLQSSSFYNKRKKMEWTYGYQGRIMEGSNSPGVWEYHADTAVFKWITNKILLYSSGNSAQCSVPAWMGEEFGGEWIHVYAWLSPFSSPETITTLLSSYTPI